MRMRWDHNSRMDAAKAFQSDGKSSGQARLRFPHSMRQITFDQYYRQTLFYGQRTFKREEEFTAFMLPSRRRSETRRTAGRDRIKNIW